MVCRRQQDTRRRPVIDLLNEHGDKPLKFADFTAVVAALGDSIELVQKQNAVDRLGVFENVPEIAARATKKAAHDGRKIEDEKRSP